MNSVHLSSNCRLCILARRFNGVDTAMMHLYKMFFCLLGWISTRLYVICLPRIEKDEGQKEQALLSRIKRSQWRDHCDCGITVVLVTVLLEIEVYCSLLFRFVSRWSIFYSDVASWNDDWRLCSRNSTNCHAEFFSTENTTTTIFYTVFYWNSIL